MLTQRQLFLSTVAQTSNEPLCLEIDFADGCWMFTVDNKKYLDLISGISVSNLGHNNAQIKNAIKAQLDKYMHLIVYGEFIETPQVQLANWLKQHLPQQLNTIYFTNSGSEAIEGALKLAKRYTGRFEIIAFRNAYHGSTHGALSVGGNEERKNSFRPLLPNIKNLDFNNVEQLNLITTKTACVLIEPIQAEAGIILPNNNYLQLIRNRCNETKTLLIFDENQTGFGRTGKLFAFENYHVIPDILVLGKAFGGGMPLGAFVSSSEILSKLTNNPVLGHITTFGGHPICCASGYAAALELIHLNVISTVESKAQLFKNLLIHPQIKEIRNAGLLMAIQFKSEEFNMLLIHKLVEKGLVTDWFLFSTNSMRIAPPLIIKEEEIIYACNLIIEVLNTI